MLSPFRRTPNHGSLSMKPYSSSLLPLLTLLLLASAPVCGQQVVQLQQQMGATEFKASGLEKLSPSELHHLQQWLAEHSGTLTATVPASEAKSATAVSDSQAATSRRGWFSHKSGSAETKAETKARNTVVSKIAGNFNGWDPGSILTLQNGQKWRVTDDSSLTVRETMASPEVTVKPGFLGSWTLKVRGYNTNAKVQPAN
jgi:hypothetical protein